MVPGVDGLDGLGALDEEPAPRAVPGGAPGAPGLLDWPAVGRLLAPCATSALLAREGRLRREPPPRSLDEARALFSEGWTVVLRSTDRHDPAIGRLAAGFAARFSADAKVQVYATPAGLYGFDWHYDAEAVFILQAAGVKDYFFRANTVNPRPRLDAMPADQRYEAESSPLLGCALAPGDWLYLPSGWWHRARAREDSLSLSVGLLPRGAPGFGRMPGA